MSRVRVRFDDDVRDHAAMVWSKTAGRWGWLDADLGELVDAVRGVPGRLEGWVRRVDNRVATLEDRVAALEAAAASSESSGQTVG